jgi:hypothetical protein
MPKPLTPAGQRAKPRPTPPSAPAGEPKSNHAGGNRPVKEFRHRSLRATIWKNDTDKGVMYNVTLTRMYRDGEKWKDSQSFGFDDLMNLAKLLADAHTYISVLRDRDFASSKVNQPAREDGGGNEVAPF